MNKVFNFFMGFVPFLVYNIINYVVFIIAIFYTKNAYFDSPNSAKINMFLMLLIGAVGLLVFGIWYKFAFGKIERTPLCLLFSFERVLKGFFLAFCYQISITMLVGIFSTIFPDIVNNYADLMEDFTEYNGIGFILYSCVFAPITEELIFRGVTYNHFRRAVPFWLANILQALLFGVMHMNLVQGTYAFIIGLAFGLVYRKYNSLYATIFLHILINSLANFVSELDKLPNIITVFIIIISFIASISSIFFLTKKNKYKY